MRSILFDLSVCQPIGNSKFHGGGEYGYIVFKELIKRIDCSVIPYYYTNKFIDETVKKEIESRNLQIIDASTTTLKCAVEQYQIDTFYSPLHSPSYKFLYNTSTKCLLTVHGLRALEMNRDKTEIYYATSLFDFFKAIIKQTPVYYLLKNKYWKQNFDLFSSKNFKIVTVSNHSKYSILNYYPTCDKEKIVVRYSPSVNNPEINEIVPYSTNKYYLIISANRWLKNAYRSMKAFDDLVSKGLLDKEKMIVVGLSTKTLAFKKIRNKNNFILLDYVSRDTLESLYKGAYALIYPSLNEGFGYPPFEAMKYGVPVITSSFASIAEVCGDSVLYTNPYSTEEIGIRILELNDPLIYKSYMIKALERHNYISKRQKEDLQDFIDDIICYAK